MYTQVPDHEYALAESVNWLRERLTAAEVASTIAGSDEDKIPPPFTGQHPWSTLSQQLGLSLFDQKTLLLCAAIEFAPSLAELYARAQGNPDCTYPTFALAFTLFKDASWEALSPSSPLRYWHLVDIHQQPDRPMMLCPLQADERIVNYLKGLNKLDHRLWPYLLPLRAQKPQMSRDVSHSQQLVVDRALSFLDQPELEGHSRILQLVGSDSISKQLVAQEVATRKSLTVYSLPAQLIPNNARDIEEFAHLWQRECLLLPLALYLDASEVESDAQVGDQAGRIRQFLHRSGGLFMLDTRDVWYGLEQANCTLDIRKPTSAEQAVAWESSLLAEQGNLDQAGAQGQESHGARTLQTVAARLAGQFNMNLTTIHSIVRTTVSTGAGDDTEVGRDAADRLWQACLSYTRPRLDMLAQRVVPKAKWTDIVLPSEQLRFLRHIADQVDQRSTVYDDWGFRRRSSRGLGITVLFGGESGTGKTLAAEILANHLKLNLYRIDLSAVVSKYIGETEKNLRKLFDAAEDGGAVLFFDEADALFGKRSEVKDSHDRYANIEVSYLLQRLEAYQGLAILATNLKSGLDDAFTRRLRFMVSFPKPDEAHRKLIWQMVFPPETPLLGLDYHYLAGKFKLSGGSIYNIALNAAFMAAKNGMSVSMPHVLEAIRIEYAKDDRMLNERDFEWLGVEK